MKKLKQTQALKPLTEQERVLIANYHEKRLEKKAPKIKLGAGNKVTLDELTTAKMAEALGVTDQDLTSKLLNQAISTFSLNDQGDRCNNALALLYGIKPKDELESLLAVQMIGVHNMAMDFMQRAMLPEQTFDGLNLCMEVATKMLRTFTAQIEALNRHRGKGQQKMTVEHVHVHEGGQAIVGNVQPKQIKEGGGGNDSNNS